MKVNIKIRDENDVLRIAKTVSNVAYWGPYRYRGLNLTNVGLRKKNTIEFRLSNGSVDYGVWRENIMLYGRMIQMAKMQSIDPTRKKKEMEAFFEKEIPEKEKIKRFLNLVFDNDEEKEIFYKRWQYRAGEVPVFGWESVKTYKGQYWKEHDKGESMVKQIAMVAKNVPDEKRLDAMKVLINEERPKTNAEID